MSENRRSILYCDTLGEAWLTSLHEVMKYGVEIKDTNVRVRDLGPADAENNETIDVMKLKEVRNLWLSVGGIDENDEIIKEFADQNRIEYTRRRYGNDTKTGYGRRIYDNDGVNQFEWLVQQMKDKPETKSATITIMRAGEKSPCISLVDFKYRNEKMDMSVVYRSQNVFLKQPGNILALWDMQKSLAMRLGCAVGRFDLLVYSAHVYECNYNAALSILERNGCGVGKESRVCRDAVGRVLFTSFKRRESEEEVKALKVEMEHVRKMLKHTQKELGEVKQELSAAKHTLALASAETRRGTLLIEEETKSRGTGSMAAEEVQEKISEDTERDAGSRDMNLSPLSTLVGEGLWSDVEEELK